MAARKTASTTKENMDAGASKLADFFKSRAPVEDREAYTPQAFAKAAELAYRALEKHKRGDSLVVFDNKGEIERQGRTLTAITIVNDNMPFLFDSAMGEISDDAGEALLVLHPVVLVRHEKKGVSELLGEAGSALGDAETDRVSIIHVHVARLTDEECAALKGRLEHVLRQVRSAVSNWKPMLARLDQAITEYRYNPIPIDKAQMTEAVAFLEWLRDDNFTFLGMRELRYSGGESDGTLERSPKGGLGILADPDVRVLRRGGEPVTTTPEIREFLHGPEALLVTKANAKSVVHRRIYLDYIGVKTFDPKGRLLGELRIVGLFTSTAYTRSVLKIPYLRSKVQAVVEKSGFDPGDHSGKALINVLESYPRDELFQISVPILRRHAEAILALGERPRVRILHRVDQFDRFVSAIVYVPRDRYDSDVRERIGRYLARIFDGRLSAYYPAFPEGSLARVHFIIGRSDGKTPQVDTADMEAALRDIVRTFDDALREEVTENRADPKLAALAAGFGEPYRNSFSARDAMRDAAIVAGLGDDTSIAIDFYRQPGAKPSMAGLKIYHQGEAVALSKRVPLLENMGFRVISERTFELARPDAASVFLHDMELASASGAPIDVEAGGALLEEVFLSVWNGQSDNDAYAALVQTAGLPARDIGLLRAYGRYLQQAGIPQSQDFVASTLNRYPDIARHLIALFAARFGPAHGDDDGRSTDKAAEAIEAALEEVPQIDDDAVIRRYLNLIQSTLRTNFYAEDKDGVSLAFKLDSRALRGLPDPRPWREIFVYGPQVEGVHLRFGAVARGGLRWSDRAQDYRTEVLGLVKAQQVKNAVIVPVGAKGGFFPKQLPAGSRSEIFEAGKSAYVNFISSLLSITDNLEDGSVTTPPNVLRHDGDDPYFVVAADKGTATFSDTANAISQTHDFWLDDAFASGGSAGYDHKKMGITARGAWEAVKRHFREMDRDIQTEPFTVVGVGDMSGDVFGNGMLLSKATRLIAAFDHRDIFIDPAPDAAISFDERQRLFDKGQSSWQDYDRSKLSEGGAIVSRSQKSIELSQAAADAIGLGNTRASPVEIMRAILMAKVDLLWFGGIGTYARGSNESNSDVGDKTNDALRITAAEIGAKVIGEGANLGVTQRARIEYGMLGGRCNSDAIDNSAGVNSSDVEVNIKIALASAMRSNTLTRPNRDRLLADMTDEVAHLVLANNYRQSLAISLAARRGVADLGYQERFMEALEARALLDRAVEVLPSSQMMVERESRGQPLTRAEIGVLLAYAKLVLFDDLVASAFPDDPHLETDLVAYFPAKMAKKFPADIKTHRLRREIIATQLANEAINRGGPSFISRLQDLTGRSPADIVSAYTVVRDGFDLPALYADIDALDTQIEGATQLDLYQQVGRIVHSASAWFLKNDLTGDTIGSEIERLRAARKALEPKLGKMLPPFTAERQDERIAAMLKAGVSHKLAERVAQLHVSEMIPDIALVAETASSQLETAARAFFAVTDAFRIGRIADAARSISTADYYDGLAVARATDQINAARRGIAATALGAFPQEAAPVDAWIEAGGARISRTRERLQSLTEGGDITVSRLTVAAGLMADLADVTVN
ncbi:NAD-glutamate dehydrogenase [Aliihoeflea aestuarii]|uniref:NAD-glutamate dehydrogenase n=1 Tax=Aliihoeflea aestuarii TaxID=453840 RepID=UPI002092B2EC|nr:NAD-glutamate dehydrogenase [Aliihoeflea aestuarii]MCO6391422.1 NAD-glutamate dehydrogenase [Aliihoeflea aestuarii]